MDYSEIFVRNVPGTTEILQNSVVGIAGCGGLGSNIAVHLTRAGVGKLIIADFDVVEISNLNRQHFFIDDIGKFKVDALEKHLKSINPDIRVEKHKKKMDREDVFKIFNRAEIMIEAFDRAEAKQFLIEEWCKSFPDRSIVCGNGLSGYGKTEELKIRKAGNIYFCGDGVSDMSMGLCSPRISIASSMQANISIELLVNNAKENLNIQDIQRRD